MPRAKGVWEEQWELCDRCGFLYPISQLTKQKNLLVCTKTCVDDLSIEKRQRQIAEILADGREGDNPKSDKKSEEDAFELEF